MLGCQSEDLINDKGFFYFPLLFFAINIIVATFTSIFGPAKEMFSDLEPAKYAAQSCRLQVIVTQLLTFFTQKNAAELGLL